MEQRYSKTHEKPLGDGAQASVWLFHDSILDRPVAIKHFEGVPGIDCEPERERLNREAKLMARLNHPNIPQVYDLISRPDSVQIVFQYIEGESLADRIRRDERLSPPDAAYYFSLLASAIAFLHAKGSVHRDIKPANILIGRDRASVWIVDLGIALITGLDPLTEIHDRPIGTKKYMSPEQLAGERLSGSSDVYSLGLSLYEAVTGRFPKVPFELHCRNTGDPNLDNLVARCLKQNPEERISAADLSLGLNSIKPVPEIPSPELSLFLRNSFLAALKEIRDVINADMGEILRERAPTKDAMLDHILAATELSALMTGYLNVFRLMRVSERAPDCMYVFTGLDNAMNTLARDILLPLEKHAISAKRSRKTGRKKAKPVHDVQRTLKRVLTGFRKLLKKIDGLTNILSASLIGYPFDGDGDKPNEY